MSKNPILHRHQEDNHRMESWVYADEAARTAASGFTADDIGRVAYQEDDGTYWRLTDESPVTWVQVGGGLLAVEEVDGTPSVSGVNTIKVSNGTLTDDGGGIVSITTGGGGGVTLAANGEIDAGKAVNASDYRLTGPRQALPHRHMTDDLPAHLQCAQAILLGQVFG